VADGRAPGFRFERFAKGAKRPRFPGSPVFRVSEPPPPSISDDERATEIGDGLGSDVLDPASPIRAEIIVAQAVPLAIDDRFESRLERCPLGGIDLDLKDPILDALSEIAAGFGDPPQAPGAPSSAVLTS
jgi:hypothetical protein